MSEMVTLEVERRASAGKGVARKLRADGKIPAVCYGREETPLSLALSPDDVVDLFDNPKGKNVVFHLKLDSGEVLENVMVKTYQIDPVRRNLLHVDFFMVDLDREIRALVPVHPVGTPKGVRMGGILSVLRPDMHIMARPMDIPARIEVEVDEMVPGNTIQAEDVVLPENVGPGFRANYGLLTVVMPRKQRALLKEQEGEAEA